MSRGSTFRGVTGGIFTAGMAASIVYALIVRRWHMRWGAATCEFRRTLPGDDLVRNPRYRATHGITICTSAAEVWPWLVQIGQGRGGFYSYDWLENMLGLDIHSADRIIPDYQTLEPGDEIPLASGGFGIPVVQVEPCQALVMGGRIDFATRANEPDAYFEASWVFVLDEVASGITRLLERFQYDHNPGLMNALMYRGIVEPGSFIMQRKMLLGIKQRAEAQARSVAPRTPRTIRLEAVE
jgi:hypothetical protein